MTDLATINAESYEAEKSEYGVVPSRVYEQCNGWVLILGHWTHSQNLYGCKVVIDGSMARVRPYNISGLLNLKSRDDWWKNSLIHWRLNKQLSRQRGNRPKSTSLFD